MSEEKKSPADGYSETDAIRAQHERSQFREHSVPLYLTSSFVFDDAEQARALFADEIPGNIYTRFSNPNSSELVQKLCLLEGTEDGIATASGMAAMYVSMAALLKSGDHVLASRSVFGSTHQIFSILFPRFGISYTYVDMADPGSWEKNIQKNKIRPFLFNHFLRFQNRAGNTGNDVACLGQHQPEIIGFHKLVLYYKYPLFHIELVISVFVFVMPIGNSGS